MWEKEKKAWSRSQSGGELRRQRGNWELVENISIVPGLSGNWHKGVLLRRESDSRRLDFLYPSGRWYLLLLFLSIHFWLGLFRSSVLLMVFLTVHSISLFSHVHATLQLFVLPLVTLYFFLWFYFFDLTAPANMVWWPQIWPLPTRTRLR